MAGIFESFQSKDAWSLTSLDDGTVLRGQYPAADIRFNTSAGWASVPNVAGGNIIAFDGASPTGVSFTSTFWSHHEGILGLGASDRADRGFDAVMRLTKPDPQIGRPHRYALRLGEREWEVVVTDVAELTVAPLRSLTGTMRGVDFRLSMLISGPVPAPGIRSPAVDSTLITAREGDSYESIAKRVHGDPAYGEALRRRHVPTQVTPGAVVRVPARRRLTLPPATPASPHLARRWLT